MCYILNNLVDIDSDAYFKRSIRSITLDITSCVAAECGRHGMPPPACKNPTSQLYSWA